MVIGTTLPREDLEYGGYSRLFVTLYFAEGENWREAEIEHLDMIILKVSSYYF